MAIDIQYNVVVIDENTGKIIGVEPYDSSRRPESVAQAALALAKRLGIDLPPQPVDRGQIIDGLSWGRMSDRRGARFETGMVEVSFGRWGFEAEGA
ncbi:MAG: hypothetical protein V3V34_11705 [Kiloniellales bacterium]